MKLTFRARPLGIAKRHVMHLSTASYGSKFSQILEKRDNKNVIDFFIESYSFNASLVI